MNTMTYKEANQENPITVFTMEIGDREVSVVSARDVHDFLEEKVPFEAWFNAFLDEYDFMDGRHYVRVENPKAKVVGDPAGGTKQVVHIENTDIPVIAYQDNRVIITEVLAQVYGTEPRRISENAARNPNRFEAGLHYFKLEGEELTSLKRISPNIPRNTKHLILWTERGALRHAKMLETDQAWDVFNKLEDAYFGESASPSPDTTVSQDYFVMLKVANRMCMEKNTEESQALRKFLMETGQSTCKPVNHKTDTQQAPNECKEEPSWVVAKRALGEYSQFLSKHNTDKYSALRTLITERALFIVMEHYSPAWATLDPLAKEPLTHALYANLLSYEDAIYWSITEAFPDGPFERVWPTIVYFINTWQPFNRIKPYSGDDHGRRHH